MNEAALYIHIPFCVSKCSYCDFFSIPCGKVSESYIDRVLEEHDYRKNMFPAKWSSVYVGGGTPSLLSNEQILKLFSVIKPNCIPQAEVTFECNPDDVTGELLSVLIAAGVTRISLGIQTFCDAALKFCKRRSTKEINHKALSLVKAAGFPHFSADIISGLPPQPANEESLYSDIDSVISYGVDHISLYSLTIEDETPLYNEIMKNPSLINEEASDELWIKGRDYLITKGYYQYEVSNFAKKNAESIHNCTYWNMKTYLGLGAGAAGTIFSGNTAVRTMNSQNIEEYLTKPFSDQEESLYLDEDACMNEYLMMGFRKIEGVDPKDFFSRFNLPLEKLIEPVFTKWRNMKRAIIHPSGSLALTQDGMLFLNTFLLEILK